MIGRRGARGSYTVGVSPYRRARSDPGRTPRSGAVARGVDMGPSAVRVAQARSQARVPGSFGRRWRNAPVAIAEPEMPRAQRKIPQEIRKPAKGRPHRAANARGRHHTSRFWAAIIRLQCGSVSGVAQFYRRRNREGRDAWLDAHSDINTPETSPAATWTRHAWPPCLACGPGCCRISSNGRTENCPGNAVFIRVRDIDVTGEGKYPARGMSRSTPSRTSIERGMRTVR